MQKVRVGQSATDEEIQCRLQQLYSNDEMQCTRDKIQAQLTSMQKGQTNDVGNSRKFSAGGSGERRFK